MTVTAKYKAIEKIPEFLSGDGEMSQLIADFDWSKTDLGPISLWPSSLITTLSIVVNSKFPMFLWWGKKHIQFYNDAYRPSLGSNGKHPKALGQLAIDCWPEIWEIIKPLIDNAFLGHPHWSEDQLVPIYRNGQLENVYWTFGYSPVKDELGEVQGVLVVCNETTAKVLHEQRLQESEIQLRFAVEGAQLATWDLNPITNKFSGNRRYSEWFGIDAEQLTDYDNSLAVIDAGDRERVIKAYCNALDPKSGSLYDIEYAICPKNRQKRIVRALGKPWFNDQNIAYRFTGILQDITAEVIARKKVEDSERQLRNIILRAPVAMCILSGPQYIVTIANDLMYEILGKSHEELHGRPLFEVLPEVREQGLEVLLDNVFHSGETIKAYEVPVMIPRNNQIEKAYVDFVYEAFKETNDEISGVMAVAIDVTEQVITRFKIEQAEEKAKLAIESADLGAYEVNLKTDEIKTSERFNAIWGIDGKKRPSASLMLSVHPDDIPIRSKAHDEAVFTGNLDYQVRIIWEDLSIHWIRAKGTVVYDHKGEPQAILGVIQDITEQKQFSEELSKQVQQRTLELQRSNEDLLHFAHVASHDLKEPIRKIKVFSNMLQEQFEDHLPGHAKIYLDKIHHATNRMFSMIEGVLNYSSLNASGQPIEKIDLNEIFDSIEIDLEVHIQRMKAVITRQKLPVIEGASVLIYQLFYNLINNALKFSKTEENSLIAITATEQSVDGENYITIVISDNGIGLDTQYADHIFCAFSRLNPKDEYEGTGLGLSLCKKIAERHHGTIEATGEVGCGTNFTVKLPLKQHAIII